MVLQEQFHEFRILVDSNGDGREYMLWLRSHRCEKHLLNAGKCVSATNCVRETTNESSNVHCYSKKMISKGCHHHPHYFLLLVLVCFCRHRESLFHSRDVCLHQAISFQRLSSLTCRLEGWVSLRVISRPHHLSCNNFTCSSINI